ncbi:MAG: radical SAM protein [Gammaproteobacteria bacterium]|nr:radical SAM protein [Gammaproteobacteria bacterium]
MHTNPNSVKKIFHFIMIKPSHYDDDGYVIQWVRSSIPANSLATVYGLAMDCAKRRVLGENVDIRLTACDETNSRIRTNQLSALIRKDGGHGLVGLVGVQTNQFPRAMDLARKLRAADIQVCIGGFHISGCLAMLKTVPADIQEALDMGISLFAGELEENRLEPLLLDADRGKMKPIYDFMGKLPALPEQPAPYLPVSLLRRTAGVRTSFDAGRGCPFVCSFCTIINVQGRKSRFRTADDVERIVRTNAAQGVSNFFISDDNFARNKNWESILDRLIELQEKESVEMRVIMQVDTMSHKISGFIEKAGRAGVDRVFIGIENINPDALKNVKKGQNHIAEYRALLQAWHNVGVLTYGGYILGFPADTPETIERDIKIIQRELPVDILELFILTPLPGSQDHKALYEQGAEMERDMNKYDLEHVITSHPNMSKEEWKKIYLKAWDIYYTPAHVETVIRRAKVWGYEPDQMKIKLLSFYGCVLFEKIHPLEGGIFRRKHRRDRRPGLPLENPLVFYPKHIWETLLKYIRFYRMTRHYNRICKRVIDEHETDVSNDAAMRPLQ